MRPRPTLLLPIALAAGGCAPAAWVKPGVQATEQARDLDECHSAARARSLHEINARILSQPYGTGVDRRGHATLAPPLAIEGDRAMIEHAITAECMRSRGCVRAPGAAQRPQ